MSKSTFSTLLAGLKGGLIVSVQADEGSPLRQPEIIAAMAQAAAVPGVVGLRIDKPNNIAAVRAVSDLPIIGIYKEHGLGERVWITPTFERAQALARAGASLIALDATRRDRLLGESLGELIHRIHEDLGLPVLADISDLAEGLEAAEAGADLVGTTLSGYTRPPFASPLDPPDLALIRELRPVLRVPLIAEGRYNTPLLARQALEAGAAAVVVGSMITRPEVIARTFVEALKTSPSLAPPPLERRTTQVEGLASKGLASKGEEGEARVFLGVDGGQTTTLAVLVDGTGRLLGVGRAGPSNHLHEPGGPERLRRALHGSLSAAWEDAGLPSAPGQPFRLEGAFCGMTGGAEQVEEELLSAAEIGRLGVDYDLVTAHAGAFLGEPGVVVIGGTGSVAYGQNPQGQARRAGGWAHLIGDEGSAYDIGRSALAAAARVEDGRGPDSSLHADLLAHFHCTDFWDVRRLVYAETFDRRQVAALAPLVSRAASRGDRVSLEILEHAGQSLAELGLAVLQKLGMDQGAARVSPVGGVFKAGELVLGPFNSFLKAAAPEVTIVPPAAPPVVGAALLALRLSGVKIDEGVKRNLLQAAGRVTDKSVSEKPSV